MRNATLRHVRTKIYAACTPTSGHCGVRRNVNFLTAVMLIKNTRGDSTA